MPADNIEYRGHILAKVSINDCNVFVKEETWLIILICLKFQLCVDAALLLVDRVESDLRCLRHLADRTL